MGLFGKILSGLEVIGGAALEFIPGGQLAGAMLITEGLASSGLIGGSVGKFLKSGLGQGLMLAASAATLAYGMYGQAANAETAAANPLGTTSAGKEVSDVTQAGEQIATPSGASAASGVDVNAFPTAQSAAAGGSTPAALQATPQVDAMGSQITSANNTAQVASEVNPGANAAVNPAAGTPPPGIQAPTGPNTVGTPSGNLTPSPDLSAASYAQTHGLDAGMGNPAGAVTDTSGQGGGMLSRLFPANSIGPSPGSAAIQGGFGMLGGIGQGIEQKQAMEQQAAAQQYATRSYAGGPPPSPNINVPQGYLARAQALKGMLGTTQGIQPAPAGSNTPVPIWQMNSAPRGGVPGG